MFFLLFTLAGYFHLPAHNLLRSKNAGSASARIGAKKPFVTALFLKYLQTSYLFSNR